MGTVKSAKSDYDGNVVVTEGDQVSPTHTTASSDEQRQLTLAQRNDLTFKQKAIKVFQNKTAFIKTREFWIVLLLGQVLSLCITGTNTLNSLLRQKNWSVPTIQLAFNYAILNMVYTPYTIYKYGFRGWAKIVLKDGWRYFILAFLDVEGNFFTVLAYDYTTILSAQLINFWAIVIVVAISFIFLKVRYHITQYAGILVCVGGMGMLIASDHMHGDQDGALDQVKGDLFALLGATLYGCTNIFEEFLVSKKPLFEVLGQLAFWALPIAGVQSAIFERDNYLTSDWNGVTAGYVVGFALILSIFYSLAPIMFRLASAAFFNISLLTANFWGVIIGIHVLHEHIYPLYPPAFVLILCGLLLYFVTESVLGEGNKPWLGKNQEKGVNGIGTAKRKLENNDNLRIREDGIAVENDENHDDETRTEIV